VAYCLNFITYNIHLGLIGKRGKLLISVN